MPGGKKKIVSIHYSELTLNLDPQIRTPLLRLCTHPLTPPTGPSDSTHLEYGVVVDGCEVEAEVDALKACVSKVISGTLVDVTLGLALTVVRQTINLHTNTHTYPHIQTHAYKHTYIIHNA